jgi:hypothetical protein
MTVLVRIVAPHFVAGVVFDGSGTCVEAAPIVRRFLGLQATVVRKYVDDRGWEAKRV